MLPENQTTTGPRATRKEWIGLAVIAIACLLYVMDLSVLYLAMPSLTRDLAPSSTQLLWISDIYGFMVAGFLITMGTLGDRIGRRKVLLYGGAAFGLASLSAAFSNSAEMLIASRALLGIAGATIAPSTLALIANMFQDPKQRMTAIGLWGTSFSAGAAVGPLLGGILLQSFWWGSVFLLNVPVMIVLLILGPKLLPEYRDENAGRIDLRSAALSLVGVLGIIYGLKQTAQDGFGPATAVPIVVGVIVGAIFIRRQRRLADPLLDLKLFRIPKFSVSVASNALTGFVAFGTFLYVSQYLQLVLGLTPLKAGLWTLPSSLAVISGSLVAPVIGRRVRPAFGVAGGLLLGALGLITLTQVGGENSLGVVVAGSIIFALGLGPVFILATDLIMGTAPPERAGSASAISETGAEFGGAAGIAILGTLGTAVYRSGVADVVRTVPTEARAAAQDTLGGALAVAEKLPTGIGSNLIEAAQAAFTTGLQLTAAICAVAAIGIAIVVATALREIKSGNDAEVGHLEPAAAEC